LKPLVDQYAKEGKDKKVTFEGVFSKPNSKPKWFLRKDVCNSYNYYLKYNIKTYIRTALKKLILGT